MRGDRAESIGTDRAVRTEGAGRGDGKIAPAGEGGAVGKTDPDRKRNERKSSAAEGMGFQ